MELNESPAKKQRVTLHPLPKTLPAEGFIREATLLSVLAVSRFKFRDGLSKGQFPAGRLLGTGTRVWTVNEIRDFIATEGLRSDPIQKKKQNREKTQA